MAEPSPDRIVIDAIGPLITTVIGGDWVVCCGIRANAATDSDGKRPPNPIESGHRFRTKPATPVDGVKRGTLSAV
jgi:hypothetical protein